MFAACQRNPLVKTFRKIANATVGPRNFLDKVTIKRVFVEPHTHALALSGNNTCRSCESRDGPTTSDLRWLPNFLSQSLLAKHDEELDRVERATAFEYGSPTFSCVASMTWCGAVWHPRKWTSSRLLESRGSESLLNSNFCGLKSLNTIHTLRRHPSRIHLHIAEKLHPTPCCM